MLYWILPYAVKKENQLCTSTDFSAELLYSLIRAPLQPLQLEVSARTEPVLETGAKRYEGKNTSTEDLTSQPLMQWRISGWGYHFRPMVHVICCWEKKRQRIDVYRLVSIRTTWAKIEVIQKKKNTFNFFPFLETWKSSNTLGTLMFFVPRIISFNTAYKFWLPVLSPWSRQRPLRRLSQWYVQ